MDADLEEPYEHGELAVWLGRKHAGALLRHRTGQLSFRYDDEYLDDPDAIPWSCSLPLSKQEYSDQPGENTSIARWLHQTFPVGESLRSFMQAAGVQKELGDASDFRVLELQGTPHPALFDLLSTGACVDMLGAISFRQTGEMPSSGAAAAPQILSDADVVQVLHYLTHSIGGRWDSELVPVGSPLGGFSSKMALHRTEDEQWAVPDEHHPSTHILKARPNKDYERETENKDWVQQEAAAHRGAIVEHLCLAAAKRIGLDVVNSELVQYGNVLATVVKRYDRQQDADGKWERIHQENLVLSETYHNFTMASSIWKSVQTLSSDADADTEKLRDATIYNWLIMNRDAYPHNFAFLWESGGSARLAPIHDLHSSVLFNDDFAIHGLSYHGIESVAANVGLSVDEWNERSAAMASDLEDAMETEIGLLPERIRQTWQYEINLFQDRLAHRISVVRGEAEPHGAFELTEAALEHLEYSLEHRYSAACPLRVRHNRKPCVLTKGHGGWCRSKIKNSRRT